MKISEITQKQKEFFYNEKTKDVNYRIKMLKNLRECIKQEENKINEALKKDLNKSEFETYMTETGMVLSELNHAISHIKKWSRTKKVVTPLAQFHSKSFIKPEPYGIVLVIAPWNYPFMLSMDPLIEAIAAGNCVILKPSEYAPNTANVLKEILKKVFPMEYVTVIEGGIEETTELLEQDLDYIFFTGGSKVGQIVMEKASKHLTPVTLELGGKSPCIITKDANISLAAKRIAFGKLLNAGQTCVAPDYILVEQEIKGDFIHYLEKYIKEFLGEKPLENENYPKIINEKHFHRIQGYLENQNIIFGGKGDSKTLKIEPTLLEIKDKNADIMQEEIFGPILPIITFQKIEDAISYVKSKEKPLALYLFTNNLKTERKVLSEVSFGGGCINDTIIHLASNHLGFGGVGKSGMGDYHGKNGFDTFTHYKSILKKYNWIDMPMRYMPYTKLKAKLVRMFLR